MTYEDALNIYTDGSCLSNPRRGGIGIRYIVINAAGDEEWVDEAPPGYKQATNNELELMACIVALRGIPQSMVIPPFLATARSGVKRPWPVSAWV